MLLLVPTLFFTSGLAILVWLWAVGTYFIARAIYNRLPVNVRGAMQVKMPGGKQVIFHKDSPSGNGFDTIKAEAAEVRD
jgi:hypothetical protein